MVTASEPTAVVLREFHTRMEAEMAKSVLTAFGIESFLSGDDCGGQRPSFITVQRIRVLVSSSDLDLAEQVLVEDRGIAEAAVREESVIGNHANPGPAQA